MRVVVSDLYESGALPELLGALAGLDQHVGGFMGPSKVMGLGIVSMGFGP